MIRCGRDTRLDDGNPEWLHVIWESNAIDPEMFGAPENKDWWAGGTVEEYEHARVIFRTDPSVSIVPKTEHGEAVLRQAAEKLGIHIN